MLLTQSAKNVLQNVINAKTKQINAPLVLQAQIDKSIQTFIAYAKTDITKTLLKMSYVKYAQNGVKHASKKTRYAPLAILHN